MTVPDWLHSLAIVSLILAGISFILIAADLLNGHQQPMWIMNLVWPLTALYAGPLAVWAYYRIGRTMAATNMPMNGDMTDMAIPTKPFWQSVGLGALHCGSGCTLGDILAESFLFFVPLTLFGSPMYAAWAVDFVLAFLIGIIFQYFAIKPMRNLTPREGLIAAVKADALSLSAWQIGMYGWMAITTFLIFRHELPKNGPVFWFMMQLAMLAGFLTSYPVNWWLIRSGVKEKM